MAVFKQYIKKPIVIQAIKWDGKSETLQRLQERKGTIKQVEQDKLIIPTLEGNMIANLGDYIIFGIKGEPYPCKPDIFEATYNELMDL